MVRGSVGERAVWRDPRWDEEKGVHAALSMVEKWAMQPLVGHWADAMVVKTADEKATTPAVWSAGRQVVKRAARREPSIAVA